MNSILWGCCWFNEPVDVVINFLKQASKTFETKKLGAYLLVFVANTKIKKEDIEKLQNSIKNVIILKNKSDIYPNKNYGVYSIIKYAHDKKIKYISIVDPDWSIKQSDVFIDSIVLPIIHNEADIIIPNICNAAGRANKIIGRTIIELLYPEYKDLILTPFPGSFSALTEKIYPIVNSDNYHFDWGGEWDIISYSIKNNLKIKSVKVDVENVRHRNNESKMHDSYQIWRAVFSNTDVIGRYNNILKYKPIIQSNNQLSKVILNDNIKPKDIIKVLDAMQLDSTDRQLLYMIVYPLTCLIYNKLYNFKIIEESLPYDKDRIDNIKDIAIIYAQKCIKNSNISIEDLYKNANSISGSFFGDWNKDNIKQAKEEINKQIQEIL